MIGALAALRRACAQAVDRIREDAWRLLQQGAAATIAWDLASHLIGRREAFFAPMAAVVALNAPLGERGGNTLRLLEGVVIGIVVGELALGTLGANSPALLIATLVAMAMTRAVGGTALSLAQAATAAILTITTGSSEVGPSRLIDALIGGGVALLFSQVLFTPRPLRLLRRAETEALAYIANALDLTARALEEGDQEPSRQALDDLRHLRDRLTELARTRRSTPEVARRSAAWRAQHAPVVEENENAGQLDLLGTSALMAVRSLIASEEDVGDSLAGPIRDLASAIRDMAQDPGDRTVRQRAADRALQAARQLRPDREDEHTETDSVRVAALYAVAVDTMVFAGADPSDAVEAIRSPEAELHVATPATSANTPRKRLRRLWNRAAAAASGSQRDANTAHATQSSESTDAS